MTFSRASSVWLWQLSLTCSFMQSSKQEVCHACSANPQLSLPDSYRHGRDLAHLSLSLMSKTLNPFIMPFSSGCKTESSKKPSVTSPVSSSLILPILKSKPCAASHVDHMHWLPSKDNTLLIVLAHIRQEWFLSLSLSTHLPLSSWRAFIRT